MKIWNKAKRKVVSLVDNKLGSFLRARYSSFTVRRPYVINVAKDGLAAKVAIVTGGSGEIGRACSLRLAAEGATVYVCGTRKERVDAVVEEIRSLGYKAHAALLNVRDAGNIQEVVSGIYNKECRIDILVNSAGGSARNRANDIAEQSIEVIDELLEVNLRGAILCSKYVAPHMIEARQGRIINITSVIGIQGKAGFSEYASSKGGSIAFVRSLAQELGKYGITVNCVSPGIVQRGEITPRMIPNLIKTNFMNTYGKPEDIAHAVSFLCSDESSFITGENMCVDGGRRLGLKEA